MAKSTSAVPIIPFWQALIFDMDGVLIDSEPLWQQAEADVLRPLGVPVSLDGYRATLGWRVDAAVMYWYERYPWPTPDPKVVMRQIEERVRELLMTQAVVKAGAQHALALPEQLHVVSAIASSSSQFLIDAVCQRFGWDRLLTLTHSGEKEKAGKPRPDVYLTTARLLGVMPERCLVVEDSPVGLQAAKAAGMICIVVPDQVAKNDPSIAVADLILESLEQLTAETISDLVPRV